MAESLFVRVDEVCQMLAVSRAEAYRIIKRLNAELAAQGYIVMTGRVNRRYLEEHIYGFRTDTTQACRFHRAGMVDKCLDICPPFVRQR